MEPKSRRNRLQPRSTCGVSSLSSDTRTHLGQGSGLLWSCFFICEVKRLQERSSDLGTFQSVVEICILERPCLQALKE